MDLFIYLFLQNCVLEKLATITLASVFFFLNEKVRSYTEFKFFQHFLVWSALYDTSEYYKVGKLLGQYIR